MNTPTGGVRTGNIDKTIPSDVPKVDSSKQNHLPEIGNVEKKKTSRCCLPTWSRVGEIVLKAALVLGAVVCGAAAIYFAPFTLAGGLFMLLAATQAKNHPTKKDTITLNTPGVVFAVIGSVIALPLAGCVACISGLAGKSLDIRK